jgi:hypothetical protein
MLRFAQHDNNFRTAALGGFLSPARAPALQHIDFLRELLD